MVSKKQCCLTAAVFAGMLVGGLVGGVMADAYGRRPIVLLNLGINAVSALLSALSPSLNWLILFRCLAGIGVGGIVSCLFALCVEHLPTSARARYITILCSFWMVVRSAMAWVMLGNVVGTHTRILPWTNWRHFAACAGLPALTSFLLTYCYVPESPRFLASQHQYAEAASVLARIAHVNGQREYATPCLTQSDKNHPQRRQDDPYRMQWFVASSRLRKVALCLIATSFALSFGTLFGVVSTNAFPLPVRVTAMSVVSSMGRLGAIAAQFVNGFLIGPPSHLMTLLVVTASVLLIGAAAVGGVTPASTTSLPRKPKTASGRILRDTDDSTNLSSVVVRSSHMNVQDE
ncbi:hypothetical protein DYB37_010852 [Aphanomyces astaci]|uniref:Major facilitator superfamily (MFS) profile domain-containing protein n=1 Tax=Aphanomyces astaci TaxID=112090 RepID=A0A3R7AIQ5_APHAT|nr:hypothetical protein DYB37_010852 [Aphanomyces astaci]